MTCNTVPLLFVLVFKEIQFRSCASARFAQSSWQSSSLCEQKRSCNGRKIGISIVIINNCQHQTAHHHIHNHQWKEQQEFGDITFIPERVRVNWFASGDDRDSGEVHRFVLSLLGRYFNINLITRPYAGHLR